MWLPKNGHHETNPCRCDILAGKGGGFNMTGSTQYTPQFMLMVANDAVKARTYKEIARKYGLSSHTVKEWVVAFNQYGDLAFEPDGPERYKDQRIAELEKEIAELKEENEIIKKATAYFSKRNL